MIDLSFLTEEEQQIIREVLKRDAELKKAEEQRIRNLQKTVSDRGLLRFLTGEWFYETKQLRHQDRIHGTDIIRASMKQAQRPLTMVELTQVNSENLPVGSRENEDVFFPPVACGILQVVHGQRSNQSPNHLPCWARDGPKAVVQSPPKQRTNPFDGEAEDENSHLPNAPVEGPLASREGDTPAVALSADLPGSTNMHNAFVPPPAEENAAVSIGRHDCPAEVDGPGGGGGGGTTARLPAAGSTDPEPQNPDVRVSSAETRKDGNQVRSSSADAPGRRDAEEAGEGRVQDMDRVAPAEAGNGDLENTVRLEPATHFQSVFDQNQDLPEQEVTRHQLLDELQSPAEQGVSSSGDDSADTQPSETEGVCRSQDGKAADAQPGSDVRQQSEQPAATVEVGTPRRTVFEGAAAPADGEASRGGGALSSDSSQTKTTAVNPTGSAPGQKDRGEDGVYRAQPIIINETDESSTEPQRRDAVLASVPPPQAFRSPSEEGHRSAPLPGFGSTVEVSKQKDGEGANPAPVSSTFLSPSEGQTSPPKTSYCLPRSPERSPLRTFGCTEDLRSPDHQVEAHTPERPPSPGTSVRRSPSKTCHPRVLPRESTSPQAPRPPGSPLKTFPITFPPEEHHERPTAVPRQRRSPPHQAKTPVLADTEKISDIPSSAAPQPGKASEKSLARSRVPQDYQHYLGPHRKAFVPSFHRETSTSADSSDPAEAIGPGVQVTAGNLNQEFQEASGPVKSPLKRMSSSRSMEELTSLSGEERNEAHPEEGVNQSVDGDSPQMKTGLSVPLLQLEEQTHSAAAPGPSLGGGNASSSASDLSLSSGVNSTTSISSSSSILPAGVGDLDVRGTLRFAASYIQKLGEFHVFVVSCRDLAVANEKKKRSDPYVKCYLLPDKWKLGKRKTTVKRKTSHPTFNEILRFKIPLEVLKTQNLNMSVWHNDAFGRNSFLGEVDVDLSEWDFGDTRIGEYALQARASAQPSPLPDHRGQMRVAVRFLPQTSHGKRTSRTETGEVQIWVKDCKNLPPVRGVTIDPFVKCAVLPDTSRKSRQKTRVVKRTANPMFNHTMVYDGFRAEDLREACVEITVWDHDRLHRHFIGGLRLGLGTGKSYGVDVDWMDSTSDEADLWQRMLRSDGEWVEDSLPLRMLMMAKCK